MYGLYEVVTYGGGALYRDIMTAVALMSGTGSMDSLLRLALLLGLAMTLMKAVFDANIGAILKWFIMAAVIYGVLWVPKVQVHITDRFDAALSGADVANVPLGVAFVASVTSQVGDRMIQLTETSFGDPEDVEYSKTGMIYGAKVFQQMSNARITDPLFDENIQSFIKGCVYYDLLTNQYSAGDLAKQNDLWTYVTASPNPGRSMQYKTGAGGPPVLKTCAEAATLLDAQWAAEAPNSLKIQEKRLRPDLPESQLQAAATSELETLHPLVFASAKSAQETMKQLLMINALRRGMAGFAADAGASASDVLAETQADIQTRNTQTLLGSVAEKGIVILKIVVDLLFIGMFPILFPAFLLPKLGVNMMKGYMAGFLYLQLWGPMYVILHKIINVQMVEKTAAAAYIPGTALGLKLGNLASIHAANADLAAVAGAMTMMIPVLAAALTKGAMAVGSQGEALLSQFRSGAEAAGAASATGNVSIGNTALDNHSFNNISGNRQVTSAFSDNGNRSFVDGALNTHAFGATGGYRFDAARSSPAVDIRVAQGVSTASTQQASHYRDLGQAIDKTWSEAQTRTQSVATEVANAWSRGEDWTRRTGTENREGMSQMVQDLDQTSKSLQQRFGLTETDAKHLTLAAAAKGGAQGEFGLKAFGLGGNAYLDLGATLSSSRDKGISTSTALEAAQQELSSRQFSDKLENQTSNFAQQSWGQNKSFSNTYREVSSDTFASSKSVADSLRKFENEGIRWEERADYARTHSASLDQTYQHQFAGWARDRLVGTRDAYGILIDEERLGQILNPEGPTALYDRQLLHTTAEEFYRDIAAGIPVDPSIAAAKGQSGMTPIAAFNSEALQPPGRVRTSGSKSSDQRQAPIPSIDASDRAEIRRNTDRAGDVAEFEAGRGMNGNLFWGKNSALAKDGMGVQAERLQGATGVTPEYLSQASGGVARFGRSARPSDVEATAHHSLGAD